MADNTNEYGNKLLNGAGLLHLVGTIKTEISNAGGGITYTAGNGIGIDERDNNAIYVDSDVVAFKTMEDEHDGTQEYAATEIGFGGVTAAWCDADGNYTKDAWVNSAEIGIETLTYNRDDSVWEPDKSILIAATDGITFIDEPAGVTKSLNLNDREGTLQWDGSDIALADDIPTYNAGDGILIEQQVATSSAGPLRSAAEPTNTYNVSLNLQRDGGLAIDASGALYADIDLSDYATQRDLDEKQDTLTAGNGITITNNVISASGGGATYTAGDGIEVNANDEIGNTKPFDLTNFYANIFQSGTNTPTWGKNIPARATIDDIANDLLKIGVSKVDGYSLFSGVSPAAINAVNNTNWAFKAWVRNDSTATWSNNYYSSSSTSNLAQFRKQGIFILDGTQVSFYESLVLLRYAMADNIYNNIFTKAGTNIGSNKRLPTVIAALDTAISAKQDALPTVPTTDGTYFLTTTVSSGTATQAWVSIPAASGNSF